ncbi:MAG TPA: hypothetical protein ENN24_07555 [Bacteroidetes bacterium]|nr:hypothetical protein [Bacteroidota bacterium]
MDLDSIIYIVIAIILAVVNGVAQKKKKAQQKATPQSPPVDVQFDSDKEIESQTILETEGQPSHDPFSILFGNEGQPTTFKTEELAEEEPLTEQELEPEVQLTDFEQRMHERAQQMMEVNVEHRIHEFDEDSIASSAIGNAPTQEEEDLALFENQSTLVKEFDAKKAIVYAEIIKPKYFSI